MGYKFSMWDNIWKRRSFIEISTHKLFASARIPKSSIWCWWLISLAVLIPSSKPGSFGAESSFGSGRVSIFLQFVFPQICIARRKLVSSPSHVDNVATWIPWTLSKISLYSSRKQGFLEGFARVWHQQTKWACQPMKKTGPGYGP